MKIIDLTLPIYSGMPVFPGDPKVDIELIQTLEDDGFNMRRLHLCSHDGTHVNASIHGTEGGKNLDQYPLDAYAGIMKKYKPGMELSSNEGVVFADREADQELFEWIKQVRPKFVAFSADHEADVEIEKALFREEILLFERLTNLDQVPDSFMFYGTPLKIQDGDGSPIRAIAVVE